MALAHVVLQDAFDSLNPQIFPFELREDVGEVVQPGLVPEEVVLAMGREDVKLCCGDGRGCGKSGNEEDAARQDV